MADLFLPAITVDQMKEVDRLMMENFHISLPQMMEHAGQNLARLSLKWIQNHSDRPGPFHIVVSAGKGNNGGGGMVSARFLENWGHHVTVILTSSDNELKPVPAVHWKTLKKMSVPFINANQQNAIGQLLDKADLIIDALVGYSLKGALRGWTAFLAKEMVKSNTDIISLDVPSGIDGTSGKQPGICVKASATMTLALPKTGLLKKSAAEFIGELYVADIGVPPSLYTEMGLPLIHPFQYQSIIKQ